MCELRGFSVVTFFYHANQKSKGSKVTERNRRMEEKQNRDGERTQGGLVPGSVVPMAGLHS